MSVSTSRWPAGVRGHVLGQAVDDGARRVDGEVALEVAPVEGGNGVEGECLVALKGP